MMYLARAMPFLAIAVILAAVLLIELPAASSEEKEERYICTALALVDQRDELFARWRGQDDPFLTEQQWRDELHVLADRLIALQPPTLGSCHLKIVDATARGAGYGIKEWSWSPEYRFLERIDECWWPEGLWWQLAALRAECAGEALPDDLSPRDWHRVPDYDLQHWLKN